MCVCVYIHIYKIITSFKDKYDCMGKKKKNARQYCFESFNYLLFTKLYCFKIYTLN